MGETSKQVRVDNWGIFFLQRLQLFFNKTDYCDLTLQFEGNVQLKVHRLVMNACTDYFNMLEQTCEVIDGNTLVMPHDLQADVILPIVNFMYTGMLEFQMSIFDKLYSTAELMNIPVLTKLLDAQKKPIQPVHKFLSKKQPTWNLHSKKITPKVENDLPATLPGRKLPVWKRKSAPAPTQHSMVQHYYPESKRAPQDPLATYDNTPKPTRFEWPEDEITSTFNLMDNSFDDISYTSKPLLTQDDELRASTSFDEVRHTPVSNKKSKDFSNQSIDMEEVKNYVKEQKIRSDLVEYDDEDDPDSYLEHIIPDKSENVSVKRKSEKSISPSSKRVRFSVNEKENKETKVNVTPSGKSSDMNHTKIISEVLKKYPHLVKKNKNIRLKILAKSPTKISEGPKVQAIKTTSKLRVQVSSPKGSPKSLKLGDGNKNLDEGPWVCNRCSTSSEPVEFVLYYLYRKHMTDVHNEKFDSRMCKFCGHQSNKHNMLMYHQYTRHGIKPPPAYNFPKCNRCPYIALTENLLIKHKLNHTKFDLQCTECKVAFNSQGSLASHTQITGHTGKSGRNSYDCQYCTKRYHTGSNLFSHIRLVHRNEARRDGIVSIDENEDLEDEQLDEESDEYIVPEVEDSREKIKIISNIKVPTSGSGVERQTIQHEESSLESGVEADNLNSGIATSLGLVDIVVLDENQQYILHNDQQLVTQEALTNNRPEYILPEISEQHSFTQTQNINEVITSEHNVITQSMLNSSDIASTDELVMVLTDHDYNDGNSEILTNENSNIVVLYSHPVDGQENQFITSQSNLMLNSQTGLLELRNNASTETESHDTQIESIEMIQREINSHSSSITTQHEEPMKSELVHVATSTTATSIEPLTQNTVILEENQQLSNDSSDNAGGMPEKEIVTEEVNNEIIKGYSGEELIPDTQESIVTDSTQVEIDNETVHVAVDVEEGGVREVPMEIDDDCAIIENDEMQTDVLAEKHPQESSPKHIKKVSEDNSDAQVQANVENQDKEEQIDSSKINETCSEDVTAAEEDMQSDQITEVNPENSEIHENINEETDKKDDSAVECIENETVVKKELAAVQEVQHHESVENQEDIVETVDEIVEQTSPDLISEEQLGEQNMRETEIEDDSQPPVLSPQVEIKNDPKDLAVQYHNSEQTPPLHPQDIEVQCNDEATHIEETSLISNTETLQLDTAPVLISENIKSENEVISPSIAKKSDSVIAEDTEENKTPEVWNSMDSQNEVRDETSEKSETHDENSQNQQISESGGEEAAKSDETLEIEDEHSETIDDDNSQSQDSQLSQSSQESSAKQTDGRNAVKRNTCQTTKISILDDWEDTNSQQSSDNNGRKAEITVNKLIHDWDDDDDDDADEEEEEEDGQAVDA